jgi:6-phosphogluconate dehydrogenase
MIPLYPILILKTAIPELTLFLKSPTLYPLFSNRSLQQLLQCNRGLNKKKMTQQYDFGMIGLGTMGSNLVYNMCDHGFTVAGFDKNEQQVETFTKRAEGLKVLGTTKLADFAAALKSPRVIMLLVPAGAAVDAVIEELKPFLSPSDLLIDCGNSHFTDTDRRIATLAKQELHFMGIGVSGGEEGARFGPSIMPGGTQQVYERVAKVLEAISAKVDGVPCVTYLGPGSAGHYVKMVHNGIEYGLMQLISETYHLLKEGAGLSNSELQQVFTTWNSGLLKSFLIEITATVFAYKDELTGNDLIDMISDAAHQKGTGKWTSQNAFDLQVPIPVIDAAVAMRELSALKDERKNAEEKLPATEQAEPTDKEEWVECAEQALYFAFITTYAQGMALLQHASKEYNYDLKLTDVAKIWRGGCIIRATLLEHIKEAYKKQGDLPNILQDDFFAHELKKAERGIRKTIQSGIGVGIPMAALSSSLAYFDSYRRAWLPTNLIQAQRDYFGAHTYERTDKEGIFHTKWEQKQA